jgi:hypothetical protein
MRPIESNGPALLRMGPPIQLTPCIASREACRLVFRTLYSHSRTPKKSASEKCLSHGARRSRRCSKAQKGVSCAFSACSLLSCFSRFSRRAEDRRALRGHRGRQGPRALQDRKALAERRASPDHPDPQDLRARRDCRGLPVRKECAAKADRRDQQARRATRDRQDPRAIAAKQGHPDHPAHPAPQPQPRCAASTPTAIASPAKKTKSWSPRSARTPAVRLSSRGQRCAARDQRESSASACASRNSGPSISRIRRRSSGAEQWLRRSRDKPRPNSPAAAHGTNRECALRPRQRHPRG